MLLAVDSSTQVMGLALYDGASVISEVIWRTQNHHTVELASAIKSLFLRSGVTTQDLSALGVALGPGSFTSLRIGLAVIKGLALAKHLPVIGIPTLDILVAAQPPDVMDLIAVLQVGRNRLAAGTYHFDQEKWKAQGTAVVMTTNELVANIKTPTLVCGELNMQDRLLLGRKWKNVHLASPAQSLRRPSWLAELAWQRFSQGEEDEPITLAPIYVHIAEGIPG